MDPRGKPHPGGTVRTLLVRFCGNAMEGSTWSQRRSSERQESLVVPAGANPAPERGKPPHRESSLGLVEVTTRAKRRQSDGRAVTDQVPSELCGPRRSDRSEGFVDEGRSAASHTDHDTRAARCARSRAPGRGSGIAHSGAQNVHTAAAYLRWAVQSRRSEPHARAATPLRASSI